MSITYPLSASSFWEGLGVVSMRLELNLMQSISGQASGRILASQRGEPLWMAEVTLRQRYHSESVRLEALFNSLNGSVGSFHAYDTRHAFPASDPDGTSLAASAVAIESVGGNNKSLALNGLPADFALKIGDYLAFDYGLSNRALHQIMEDVAPDSFGTTPSFEVRPHFRTGISVGAAISLIKPTGKFKIVPGTYKAPVGEGNQSSGLSFSMVQIP